MYRNPSRSATPTTFPLAPPMCRRLPVLSHCITEPPLPVPAPYMCVPSEASATTSNGWVPLRGGPCHVHGCVAPDAGSTAPTALLEAPFSVLKAPPSTMWLPPEVRIASTGPSTVGAQPDWKAPVVGSNAAAYE